MKDYERIDISGDQGEVVVDLAAASITNINTGDRSLFWCIMDLSIDDAGAEPQGDHLYILSGLTLDMKIPTHQLQLGPWPLRYVQPPCQNLSILRKRAEHTVYKGVVRLRWIRVAEADGTKVWGPPGGWEDLG